MSPAEGQIFPCSADVLSVGFFGFVHVRACMCVYVCVWFSFLLLNSDSDRAFRPSSLTLVRLSLTVELARCPVAILIKAGVMAVKGWSSPLR